jgi:hypothetical protein
MILTATDSTLEEHEPHHRSCWECNSAHEHLKRVNTLHECLFCGRQWVFDLYLDEVGSPEKMFEICSQRFGLQAGDSTSTVGPGVEQVCVVMEFEEPVTDDEPQGGTDA